MSNLLLPSAPKIWNPRMPGGLRDGLLFYSSAEHGAYSHVHDASEREHHATVAQGSPYWTEVDGFPAVYLKDNGNAINNDVVVTPSLVTIPQYGHSTFLLRLSSRRGAHDRRYPFRWGAGTGRSIKIEGGEIAFWWASGALGHGFYSEITRDTDYVEPTYLGVISDWSANQAWLIHDGRVSAMTQNGGGFRDDNYAGSWGAAQLQFGMGTHTNYYGLNGIIQTPMHWHRMLSEPEAEWLCNPANHLRVPWRRTVWPAGGAEAVTPLSPAPYYYTHLLAGVN